MRSPDPDQQLETLILGPLLTNCYIVHDNGEAIVIDPGWEGDVVVDKLEKMGVKVKMVIATHLHIDHVNGVSEVLERFKPTWAYHEDEEKLWGLLPGMARAFGFKHPDLPHADVLLKEGDLIKLGHLRLKVLHTPGHSPGSISLLGEGLVFDGDLLFEGSIGRTDFPLGDLGTLEDSIRKRIYTLDKDVQVFPGHGPMTTVGVEKKHNMFVRG
jgi:glyoxylase-like metal-dependent hydrolase (beta-lactamase superfamily II)